MTADGKGILRATDTEITVVCCDDLDWVVMMWDTVHYLTPPNEVVDEWGWWLPDGDVIPFRYCPCCGAKLERIRKKEGEDKNGFQRSLDGV